MVDQLKKLIGLTILTLLSLSSVFAQTEFLVTVDPATGIHTKIDSLPGVKWITPTPSYTTFNDSSHHFIFHGGDDYANWYLYSIDAITGSIVSNPPFPVFDDPFDNIVELKYDNGANILYGLHWDNSEDREYLVSIDPTTGAFTKIDSLAGVKHITIMPRYTTFDDKNHRYIFRGEDANGDARLYTVDAPTGSILSNPLFPISGGGDNIAELQYDEASGNVYGLHWDNSENTEYLISVDLTTGFFTKINPLPGVKTIALTPGYTTFDEQNHRFVFRGGDDNGQWHLYSVDVATGNIALSPIFPTSLAPGDNVVEPRFDNSTGILYALHWDANIFVTNTNNPFNDSRLKVSPNPFSDYCTITLNKSYREVVVFVYNSAGQVVKKHVGNNTSAMTISRDDLPSGTYFISITADHFHIKTVKAIIQ